MISEKNIYIVLKKGIIVYSNTIPHIKCIFKDEIDVTDKKEQNI